MHHPTDRITHTTAFATPVVEHWLEREIAQWVHHEGSIRRPIAPWANALTMELYLAPHLKRWHQTQDCSFNLTYDNFYTNCTGSYFTITSTCMTPVCSLSHMPPCRIWIHPICLSYIVDSKCLYRNKSFTAK